MADNPRHPNIRSADESTLADTEQHTLYEFLNQCQSLVPDMNTLWLPRKTARPTGIKVCRTERSTPTQSSSRRDCHPPWLPRKMPRSTGIKACRTERSTPTQPPSRKDCSRSIIRIQEIPVCLMPLFKLTHLRQKHLNRRCVWILAVATKDAMPKLHPHLKQIE